MSSEIEPRQERPPILTGVGLRLRAPEDGDAAAYLAAGRNAEISRMYGADTKDGMAPRGQPEAAAWLKRLQQQSPFAWIIEHEGRPIGEVRLHSFEKKDKAARIAIGIFDPGRLGHGLGTGAMRLVLAHGFETLGLHRIDLRVLAFNERAIRCYRKCGFKVEGRLRESALIDGERHDDLIMGLLASEFRRS